MFTPPAKAIIRKIKTKMRETPKSLEIRIFIIKRPPATMPICPTEKMWEGRFWWDAIMDAKIKTKEQSEAAKIPFATDTVAPFLLFDFFLTKTLFINSSAFVF